MLSTEPRYYARCPSGWVRLSRKMTPVFQEVEKRAMERNSGGMIAIARRWEAKPGVTLLYSVRWAGNQVHHAELEIEETGVYGEVRLAKKRPSINEGTFGVHTMY